MTLSKYLDIGENYLNWMQLRPTADFCRSKMHLVMYLQ